MIDQMSKSAEHKYEMQAGTIKKNCRVEINSEAGMNGKMVVRLDQKVNAGVYVYMFPNIVDVDYVNTQDYTF